jgi:hypothetical protein
LKGIKGEPFNSFSDGSQMRDQKIEGEIDFDFLTHDESLSLPKRGRVAAMSLDDGS